MKKDMEIRCRSHRQQLCETLRYRICARRHQLYTIDRKEEVNVLEDEKIIELSFQRNEEAIGQMQEKYGGLCRSVIKRVLNDDRDTEECASDTFLRAWNAIPPDRPKSLKAYLAKIARNLAIDKYSYNTAAGRSSALTEAFEELDFCICDLSGGPEDSIDEQAFRSFINGFLREQTQDARVYFIRRYWYGESIREIADACGAGQEKVKSSLFRTRNKLHDSIKREGFMI